MKIYPRRIYLTKSIRLILLSIFLASACKNKQVQTASEKSEATSLKVDTSKAQSITLTEEQLQAVGIEIGTMEEKNLSELVRTNGYLTLPPQYIAQVSVLMGGVVKTIFIKESDYVSKGQMLASMEHPDFTKLQEGYLTTKTNLSLVEAEYIRQKQLYQGNVGAGKTFEQSEASYLTEKARLSSLENQLRMIGISSDLLSKGNIVSQIPIRSPISGYISQINVNTGTLAQPGVILFEVIDTKHLRAELIIYEKDLFKVKKGQLVNLVLANQPDKRVRAEVMAVGKTFVNTTKSVFVYAEIKSNGQSGLVPGMYADALIDVGEQKTNAVPIDAVVKAEDKEYIFLLTGQHKEADKSVYIFKMRQVKTGISAGGYVAIMPVEKLPDDPKIATKGAFFILAKSKEGEGGDD